ncbi:DUF1294 domain-containing protein [Methanofollis sp. W23]|uniref:DUF1294 domain-containing protein n=1 Tax=Methanofollis sp. W23 TaxID=2817849 RepID=UPI001AEA3964|nr:DUF1294 domain-containing protein [Methanofollis sp. W23]
MIEGVGLVFILFVLLNLYTAYLFWSDKKKAIDGRWRTSEDMLVAFSFLGPFGAWWAMQHYRHKTQKMKFKLVPVFALLHMAVAVGALYLVLGGAW